MTCTIAALMFGIWFPGPFRHLARGVTLFLTIAAVDVVLGPLLTLVVFAPTKSRRVLATDLAVILLVRVSALAYRVWTMAVEVNLFRVVTAADVVEEQLPGAAPTLRTLRWRGPTLIATDRPPADQQVEATLLGINGVHLAMQPKYCVAYDSQRAQFWNRSQPLSTLPPELLRRLASVVLYRPGEQRPSLEGLHWLPVVTPRASWTVIVDRSGTPVAFSPFDAP